MTSIKSPQPGTAVANSDTKNILNMMFFLASLRCTVVFDNIIVIKPSINVITTPVKNNVENNLYKDAAEPANCESDDMVGFST